MFRKTKVCTGLMLAFGGSLALSALPALAQETQRVEITGSSIKRIEAETALPVTIIKREEIDKSGASNVQELVDRLSANNGGGRSLGESIGETSATGQTGASLRGLGRTRTLVLLNGRRLSPYPFSGLGVDLNAIPLSAIERIEVLRDGASATYGSDAVGGVINFITRKDLQGGEVSLGYEEPVKKGGKVKSASAAYGFGDLGKDRFNILGTVNYQEYTKVLAMDRDFAQTGNRPDIGVVKTSGNTFPANAVIPASSSPTGSSIFVPGTSGFPTCAPPDSFNDGSTPNCRYDFTHYIDIYPASKRLSGLLRGTAQVAADHTLFAEASYSKNEITFGSSQTPSITTGKPNYFYPGTLPDGTLSKYYPTAAVDAVAPGYRGPLRLSWRIVDGGQRTDKVTSEQTRVVVGGEGTLAGWDYKAAIMSAEAKAHDDYVSGWYSDPELRAALATGLVNPFGPNDATGLATLKTAEINAPVRQSNTKTTGIDGAISRELFQLSAGAVGFAVGGDTRKEKYEDGYTDLAGSGNIVGGSGTAGKVTGERNVSGVFTEVNVPVLKGLEVTGAVRFDRYSNTKGESRDGSFESPNASATSPKVSLRWQPSKEVLFRASAGKGFRAPALDNLFAPSSFTNTGGNFTDPYYDSITGCAANPNTDFCNTQLTALNESNPNLKPEKSKQFSLGVVLEPVKDLSFSVDYFNIKITDGIFALTGDIIMQDWLAHQTGPTTSTSVYADRLIVDPTTGYLSYIRASLENIGVTHVAGYDLSARYRMRTPIGTVTPGWEATYLTKSTQSNVVTNEEQSILGKYSNQGPAVRLKQTLTLDWEQGAWAAGVRYYWQSGYEDYDTVRRVGSYELWDLQGQFKGVKNMTLTAGIRNLMDQKPPTTVQQDYFQVGFDPTYADVKGRTLYLRANYKF